jgi:Smg protein
MRIYSEHEKTKLDSRARGFIMFMENMGQLNASQREIVIEQVMSLEDSKLNIDDLKWVVMMVIGNSSAESSVSSQWIESIVFHDDNPTLQ